MTKRTLLSILLASLTFGAPALSDEMRYHPVAVLELFTSQGCSSCPPADHILTEYEAREDVIALAYHVDYWDYIGWQDTFGSAENSDFQRAYAKAQGKRSVYTPQLIINGTKDYVGSRRSEIAAAVAKSQLALPIDLSSHDGMLEIKIDMAADKHRSVVWLVTFKAGAEVKIERGENRGKVMHYSQIVTGRQVLGVWEPENGSHIKLPIADVLGASSDGVAIVVQEDWDGLPGPILGAVSFERDGAMI